VTDAIFGAAFARFGDIRMKRHLVFFEKEENIFVSDNSAVLLMADDRMTSEITTEMLRYLGYTVEAVTNGEEAVALYRLRKEEGNPFKAVIFDICRHECLDTEETLRRLLEYDPHAKAIASSASSGNRIMLDSEVNSSRAPLPKPYGIRQLGSILRSVIGSGLAEEGSTNIRKDVRHGIVANFQFIADDKSESVCEGVTINISRHGFGFLTEDVFTEGQAIIVTKYHMANMAGAKARVMWVRKGARQYRVGAKFVMAG